MSKICSKLIIKVPERTLYCTNVFIVDFQQILAGQQVICFPESYKKPHIQQF